MSKIHISFDLDWCPDFMKDNVLKILNNSKINCTFFITHKSPTIKTIENLKHNVGIHPNYLKNKRSYSAILSRLKWHCHFIQKFEMECDYETRCINRGYEQISYENRNELLEAWKKGQT